MESISETQWDVVIDGTGLPESLLALSLSRSGKKILHVDRNSFYGGSEAALSLRDAEEWAAASPGDGYPRCRHVSVTKADAVESKPQLGSSRQYSLALSPQIIPAKSLLLSTLVSSKTYRQLDFLAVGNWFVCEIIESDGDASSWQLAKVPASREDVFADKSLDLKAKRALIKLLRLITEPEALAQALNEMGDATLEIYLSERYKMPIRLQAALCALTMSPLGVEKTPASWALPRLSKHLASIGVFGPFAAVLPKWGGLSEVAQVACRALAVGGGTYMLGHPVEKAEPTSEAQGRTTLELKGGEIVTTACFVDLAQLPSADKQRRGDQKDLTGTVSFARSVTIVGSPLSSLFPPLGDGAPPPAAAIVVLPPGAIGCAAPVNVIVHSGDTGECPSGQCILYASTVGEEESLVDLRRAIECVLKSVGEQPEPTVLWTLGWLQDAPSVFSPELKPTDVDQHHVRLEPMSMDISFDDRVLAQVKSAWLAVSGEGSGFMEFEDREVGAYDDDD